MDEMVVCAYTSEAASRGPKMGSKLPIPLSTNPCNVKMPARCTLYVPLGNMAQYLSYVQRPLSCPFILLVLPVFEYHCGSTIFRRFTSESDLYCESHFGVHQSNCEARMVCDQHP